MKDYLTAVLLAVFTGMFGGDRFYLGYYDIAFAKLLLTLISVIMCPATAGACIILRADYSMKSRIIRLIIGIAGCSLLIAPLALWIMDIILISTHVVTP